MAFVATENFSIKPTTLFPLWNHTAEGKDPGGQPARPLGFITNQNRMAVPVWSYAMEKHPPARIVEIGAYNGGFTCALAVHAWNIGAQVYSFDRSDIPNSKYKQLAEFLRIAWFQMDCFKEGFPLITALIEKPGITYLLCDGGNKVEEVKAFAPFLKRGDVIAAHDYYIEGRRDWWSWEEIRAEWVKDALNGFEPFMQEYFDFAAWLVYKRV